MLSKKEIKDIQSLAAKNQRDAQGLFLAEGPKVVDELLRFIPDAVQKIYALSARAEAYGHLKKLEVINESELIRLSQLQTPNQVVAVVKQRQSTAPVLKNELCIYLDTIQDPGNFGTIIRTADWFGVKNIVCTEGCADVYNPKVVQSSMGSIARVAVFYDIDMAWIKKQNIPLYAATLHGSPTFSKAHSGILAIGNGSKGLRPELLKMAAQQITIPRIGEAESLNAAVATGILLSQLLS